MYPNPAPSGNQVAAGTILVGLRCPATDAVDYAEYYLFADNAMLMNDMYTKVLGSRASDPIRSVEGNCPSDGTWNFNGTEAGRLGCYYAKGSVSATSGQVTPTDEYVERVWTYDAKNILAIAGTPPGSTDAVALQSWWNDEAGPTRTADTVSGVVTSGAGAAQYKRALLTHVPAETRKNCTTIDVTDSANTHYYEKRYWLRARGEVLDHGRCRQRHLRIVRPVRRHPVDGGPREQRQERREHDAGERPLS